MKKEMSDGPLLQGHASASHILARLFSSPLKNHFLQCVKSIAKVMEIKHSVFFFPNQCILKGWIERIFHPTRVHEDLAEHHLLEWSEKKRRLTIPPL